MSYNNYTIHHLDLSSGIDLIDDWGVRGAYCIFWYRSVPLGQCYLVPAQAPSRTDFFSECAKAILPALKYYCNLLGIALPGPAAGSTDLKNVCDEISRVLHSEAVPESCDLSVVICTRNRSQS